MTYGRHLAIGHPVSGRVAMVGLVTVLAACGGMSGRSEDLVTDVRTFQEGLRWRKYDLAADYVPAAARERFLETHDKLDRDLRIDDYEVERVKIEDGAKHEAIVRVKFTWHLDSVGSVHESVVDQRWERQGKVWRVVASDHKQGEALPAGTVVSEGSALP